MSMTPQEVEDFAKQVCLALTAQWMNKYYQNTAALADDAVRIAINFSNFVDERIWDKKAL